jgi:hypothetical protein
MAKLFGIIQPAESEDEWTGDSTCENTKRALVK